MRPAPARLAVALALPLLASSPPAFATGPASSIVDRTVVRFFSPDTGGAEQPRFVTERTLAFLARLEMMFDHAEGIGDGYDERTIRTALDHHMAEEMLAALAEKLIRGSPMSRRPSDEDLARLQDDTSAAFYERLGGRDRVAQAAAAEQVAPSEIEAQLRRRTLATYYIDRAIAPILGPTDDQLREVFRTAAHPYRGRPFAEVLPALRRWFVVERLRAAENAFLQGARSRLTAIVL